MVNHMKDKEPAGSVEMIEMQDIASRPEVIPEASHEQKVVPPPVSGVMKLAPRS
jgi:hypothetical protein